MNPSIARHVLALVCVAMACAVRGAMPAAIEIRMEDVTRFYEIYEAAGGRPTAQQLQRDYLDPGTAGLRHLTRVRKVNAENIARAIATQPQLYSNARSCLAVLPRIRERLVLTFDKLLELYPEAQKPPVTLLVSRGKPVAIAGPGSGVQVALEATCSENAAKYLGANVDDRFVYVIAHEYIHVQQAPERANPTVLERALEEGVAEFLGELISGGISNVAVHASAERRERQIEERFAADLDKRELSAWFDNTTPDDVGQLGYWVGYRIAKAYYQNAPDKRAAIREMIQMTDASEFLARSGWHPGIVLAAAQSVRFEDLAGWWSAAPVHGGESSHVALQFVVTDGRQEARLWLMAIGAYDIGLGTVTLSGNSIDTKPLSFPLTWNPTTRSLTGHLPAEAAPVYDIPVEFKRAEAAEMPPAREWKAPRPAVRWSVDTGAPGWAGLERDARSGMLFVGNEQGVLHALDRDGKVRWKFETGKPIRAQPRLIDGNVYLHSDSGYLYKLHSRTGREAWRARIVTEAPPRLPTNEQGTRWDRYGSSVVADGTHIYVSSRDKNLYALDIRTGRESWRVAAGDIMTATPALYRDLVIFATFDGKVSAVSRRDGAMRWTYDAKLAVAGDVTVAGNRVLVGSRSYDLIALDAATGKEHWKRYYWFSWIESPPVVRDGVVYTGSSDATKVYAIDLADGSVRWKTAVPGYSWQRTAVNAELVIAGTVGAGEFPGPRAGALVAMDRANGAIRWIHLDPPSQEMVESRKGWGFGASPVLANGAVYAADLNGKVYAFELKLPSPR
jgi:outer membrane protein assembly factor BamB